MRFAFLLLAIASPLCAEERPDLLCQGVEPDWSLTLRQSDADLSYLRDSRLDIPHSARAEGADWPLALTLIGRNDSAILIVRQRICGDAPYEADLLTQRGETPVLLTGCCTPIE